VKAKWGAVEIAPVGPCYEIPVPGPHAGTFDQPFPQIRAMRRRYIAPFRMLYGGGPLPTWGIGQDPPSPVNSKSNRLLPASDETHTRRRERILRLDPDAAGDAGRWPPLRVHSGQISPSFELSLSAAASLIPLNAPSSMDFPSLDSPWLDREEANQTGDEGTSPSRSVDSTSSGSNGRAGFRGGSGSSDAFSR
jgi:hypothetical protein